MPMVRANGGRVYYYAATNGNKTFTSPVSGTIKCYLTSCAAQIQWYQEDTSVSITNRVLKNGAVICDCSGSQHDSDRDAWVSISRSYSGTVAAGDTIQIQKSGGGNYLGYASQVVVITENEVLDA